MPANRNALIRYKTIDNCLRNPYRRWTLEDLVDACSDALYEYEGIDKGISKRTVQMDIQMMRSEKLGYNAPIVVYENKYLKGTLRQNTAAVGAGAGAHVHQMVRRVQNLFVVLHHQDRVALVPEQMCIRDSPAPVHN